jgi:formylglycine-generating enzyme required for sulfatase activity
MSLYGDYQIIKEIGWSNGATLHSARKGGDEGYAVKVFSLAFFGFAGDDDNKAEQFSDLFNSRIENQKNAANQSPRFAPIFEEGYDHDSAWYVTRLYSNSVQKLIDAHTVLTKEEFYTLLRSIVQATLEFKKLCGRSHGNVKATNVFLTKPGKSGLDEVVLADAAPGDPSKNAQCELADLRGIGEMIHRLVINEDREEEYWRLPPPPTLQEWVAIFGRDAEAWRSLCARLLEPDLTIQMYDIEELAFDVDRLKPQPRFSTGQLASVAAVILVLAVGGVFAIKHFSGGGRAQSPDEVLQQKKVEEQNARLAREKQAAEERAEVEAKARQLAQERAIAEAKRLQEEKRLVEERAIQQQQAVEEARRKTEAAEKARLEAERIAELQRVERENAPVRTSSTEVASKVEMTETSTPKTFTSKPAPGHNWVNTFSMRFVPLPGTKALISALETRRKDYEQFVKAANYHVDTTWRSPGFRQSESDPVVNVAPEDAVSFCKWLTAYEQKQGLISSSQGYRVPDDREWSLAAGVANISEGVKIYSWGPSLPPPPSSGNFGQWCSYDRFDFTAPVGQFLPNHAGIYDLSGNVAEICTQGSGFVLRGGSWQTENPDQLNLLLRGAINNGVRKQDIGFRCVLDLAAD